MTPEQEEKLNKALSSIETLTKAVKELSETQGLFYRMSMRDKFLLSKPLVLRNTKIISEGEEGLQIGSEPMEKIGFFGTTPVIQESSVSKPTGGTTVDSEARTAIDAIIDVLDAYGLTG